jgi:hypothetical protein
LNTEERILAWITVVAVVLGVVLQLLQFIGITPSILAPYSAYVGVGLIFLALIMSLILTILHFRSKSHVTPRVLGTEPSEVEKSNFRNRVKDEIVSTLQELDSIIQVPSVISCPVWKSVTDYEKIRLLGDSDYRSVDAFYKAVHRSNEITGRANGGAIQNAIDGASYRAIIREAERIFNEISWLRLERDDVSDLLQRLNGRYGSNQTDNNAIANNMLR